MRIVIAEDAALFRAGLVRLLEDEGHQVCAEVADGEALLAAVASQRPDVVVADIRMPPTFTDEGLRAALELRRTHPGTAVLVLSRYGRDQDAASSCGKPGLPASATDKDRVLADVRSWFLTGSLRRRVAAGGTALDREVVSQLLAATPGTPGTWTRSPPASGTCSR